MSVATLREQFTEPLENVIAINMLSTRPHHILSRIGAANAVVRRWVSINGGLTFSGSDCVACSKPASSHLRLTLLIKGALTMFMYTDFHQLNQFCPIAGYYLKLCRIWSQCIMMSWSLPVFPASPLLFVRLMFPCHSVPMLVTMDTHWNTPPC